MSFAQIGCHHRLYDGTGRVHGVVHLHLRVILISAGVNFHIQDEASLTVAENEEFDAEPVTFRLDILLESNAPFEKHSTLVYDHFLEWIEVRLEIGYHLGHNWAYFPQTVGAVR